MNAPDDGGEYLRLLGGATNAPSFSVRLKNLLLFLLLAGCATTEPRPVEPPRPKADQDLIDAHRRALVERVQEADKMEREQVK